MKKTSAKIGYQTLAVAVLVSALDDSPRRFTRLRVKGRHSGEYWECNHQNRSTAVTFFKTGRFRLWADTADFSYDVLIKAHEEKKNQKLYQDDKTKEWMPEKDLARVKA